MTPGKLPPWGEAKYVYYDVDNNFLFLSDTPQLKGDRFITHVEPNTTDKHSVSRNYIYIGEL